MGLYLGVHQEQLRFFIPAGDLVPTPEEAAEAERHRAEAEQQRRAVLEAKLRELGINPDEVQAR